MPRVRELYIYPVKSLRGVRVRELAIERDGPRLDRRWMLVDENANFITQRTHPKLAQIAVTIGEGLTLTHAETSVSFGLSQTSGAAYPVTLFGQKLAAVEVAPRVSTWVSDVIGQRARLVSWVEGRHRAFAPDQPELGVRFADQKPLLLITTASLADLNQRVGRDLEMIRFRPNVVVEDADAYAEDTWPTVTVDGLVLNRLKACVRCVITTLDPLTGERGQEPLRTLTTYRRTPKGLAFGSYFGHSGTGVIREGAEVLTTSATSV